MNLETLGLLVLACLAVNLTPGPSVLLVTSVSAARGFRAGIFAVLGEAAHVSGNAAFVSFGLAGLLALVTGLVPRIGYDKAAAIAKKAYDSGKTIRQVVLEDSVLPEGEIDDLLINPS